MRSMTPWKSSIRWDFVTEIVITIENGKNTVKVYQDGKLVVSRDNCVSIEQAVTVALRATEGAKCS